MSLLFIAAVSLFISFLPTAMTVYYKASSGAIIATLIFNIIGFFTFGIGTFIAFIIAVCSIKLLETFKSILFCIFLIFMASLFGVLEIGFIAKLLS